MNIQFFPATESNLPDLLALCRLASQAPDSHWDEEYPCEEDLQADIRQGALFRITVDGTQIGMIAMGPDEDEDVFAWPTHDENACMLSRLAIHPDYQGKGLLEPVFAASVAHCKVLGYRTLRLLVVTELSRLFRVYERCGFVRCGEVSMWGQDFYQYEQIL